MATQNSNPGADLLVKTIQKIVPQAASVVAHRVVGNSVEILVTFDTSTHKLADNERYAKLIKEGLGKNCLGVSVTSKGLLVACTTLAVVTSAAKTTGESLTLLGIDGTKAPTVSRFPKSYNPKALKLWTTAIDEASQLFNKEDNLHNWLVTIKAFLKLCKEANLSPFDNANIDTHNEGIEAWLKSNRVKAIKYCDDTEIFKHFTIKSVKRSAVITGPQGGNFYVENVAQLKAIEDPTLQKWLVTAPMPGFLNNGDGSYTKTINAASSVTVNFIGSTKATLTLNIFCHSLPIVTAKGGSAVTKKALAKFIETKMWSPLVKRFKFKGIGSKLF